jgi:hypothetical protein
MNSCAAPGELVATVAEEIDFAFVDEFLCSIL